MDVKGVTKHDLYDAMNAVQGGQGPLADQKPAEGCPITWKAGK